MRVVLLLAAVLVLVSSSKGSGWSPYKITLQNHCPVTVLFATLGPDPIHPINRAPWEVKPGGSVELDIPRSWLHTSTNHGPHHKSRDGPRFWARTGCLVDESVNKAQCDAGDCGGLYDCSPAMLAGKAPVSIAEFCFECGDSLTYYDVSLVDGYSVSIDIVPGKHSPTRPGDPTNPFWCKTDICNAGVDARTTCPDDYILWQNQTNNPTPSNYKIACFSNCGKYEYPTAPGPLCKDGDPQCDGWRMYCCQADSYGKACKVDSDCNNGGACWQGVCACKAYYAHPPCNSSVCTFPDAQPPAGTCTNCIGDDVLHETCPRAYTWPNDPQTYSCDAKEYDIIFCRGGTMEAINDVAPFPSCGNLNPTIYDWTQARVDCSASHGKYLCAVPKTTKPSNNWACDVTHTSCSGVTCSWD